MQANKFALQVPTSVKVGLIDRLSSAGLRTIEATSFVSPKWVPQLADSADVMQQITRRSGTRYPVLVPNLKVCAGPPLPCMHGAFTHAATSTPIQGTGRDTEYMTCCMQGLQRAKEAGVDEVSVFAAASEAFSRRNINCSIADSLKRFEEVAQAAREAGMRVRGYVSCAVGCPYEVHPSQWSLLYGGALMLAAWSMCYPFQSVVFAWLAGGGAASSSGARGGITA